MEFYWNFLTNEGRAHSQGVECASKGFSMRFINEKTEAVTEPIPGGLVKVLCKILHRNDISDIIQKAGIVVIVCNISSEKNDLVEAYRGGLYHRRDG